MLPFSGILSHFSASSSASSRNCVIQFCFLLTCIAFHWKACKVSNAEISPDCKLCDKFWNEKWQLLMCINKECYRKWYFSKLATIKSWYDILNEYILQMEFLRFHPIWTNPLYSLICFRHFVGYARWSISFDGLSQRIWNLISLIRISIG